MSAVLWAHGESFRSTWRAKEIEWIRSYQLALERGGLPSVFASPSVSSLSRANLIQVFGSGHYETLSWLRPGFSSLVLSPLPFSVEDDAISWPESPLRGKFLFPWRLFLRRKRPQSPLGCVDAFFLPEWARSQVTCFPRGKTVFLPADPAAAAQVALEWQSRRHA